MLLFLLRFAFVCVSYTIHLLFFVLLICSRSAGTMRLPKRWGSFELFIFAHGGAVPSSVVYKRSSAVCFFVVYSLRFQLFLWWWLLHSLPSLDAHGGVLRGEGVVLLLRSFVPPSYRCYIALSSRQS